MFAYIASTLFLPSSHSHPPFSSHHPLYLPTLSPSLSASSHSLSFLFLPAYSPKLSPFLSPSVLTHSLGFKHVPDVDVEVIVSGQ